MDDYSALAQRISVSVPEVRGCMILSRDGMVLGAFPDDDESLAKAAWLRFITLGEPERSFVEFTDQTWAFVRRGPYAAFAVAEAGVRPGVMVDQLEQAMLTAEEGRTRRDTLRVPDAANAPSGKPRTSLHPGGGKDGKDGKEGKGKDKDKDRDRSKPVEVAAEAAPAQGAWSRGTPAIASGDPAAPAAAPSGEAPPLDAVVEPIAQAPVETPPPAPDVEPATALKKEPQKLIGTGSGGDEEETEVDRVLLAKEFSGLLQLDSGDDEGSS
ncbi:MAG: hypothetical protein ACXWYJ_01835 [Actinomycetota bacterium]